MKTKKRAVGDYFANLKNLGKILIVLALLITPFVVGKLFQPITNSIYKIASTAFGGRADSEGSKSTQTVVSLLENSDLENDNGWSPYANGFIFDSYIKHEGERSALLYNEDITEVSGLYQQVIINHEQIRPLMLTAKIKGENIQNPTATYYGARLYIKAHLKDNSIVEWSSPTYTDTFEWTDVGINITNLDSVNQPIQLLEVYALLSEASGTAWFDNLQLTTPHKMESTITIMFDDGNESVITGLKPIMDQYQMVGVVAIPIGSIGQPGFMTKDQVIQLHKDGWEITAHGYSHSDLTLMSPGKLRWELIAPIQQFAQMGIEVKTVAYPFGAYNGFVTQQAAKYYRSGRAYETGANMGGSWPFDIKIRSLEVDTSVEQVKGWIDQAQQNGEWLVLAGHQVGEPVDNDSYYISSGKLVEIIKYIDSVDMPVVTYNQGLDRVQVNLD